MARVLSRVVSSPASGSVTAKQAFSLPAISGGRKRSFCSALPKTTTGFSPKMFMWIDEAPENPAPDAATSCIINAASLMPSPAPPYAVGMAMPSQPALAMAAWNSSGKSPVSSFASQYSGVKSAQSRATAARILCCSTEREKSIAAVLAQTDALRQGARGEGRSLFPCASTRRRVNPRRSTLENGKTENERDSRRLGIALRRHAARNDQPGASAIGVRHVVAPHGERAGALPILAAARQNIGIDCRIARGGIARLTLAAR